MITQSVEWIYGDDKRKLEFTASHGLYTVALFAKESFEDDWYCRTIKEYSSRQEALHHFNSEVIAWKLYLKKEPSVVTSVNV